MSSRPWPGAAERHRLAAITIAENGGSNSHGESQMTEILIKHGSRKAGLPDTSRRRSARKPPATQGMLDL